MALAGDAASLVGGSEYLGGFNAAEIPRAVPAATSLLLAIGAIGTWGPALVFRLLSLHWALGAVAFALPAFHLWSPRSTWPALDVIGEAATIGAAVICALLVCLAFVFPDALAVRAAAIGAVVSWGVLLVILSAPPVPALDALAYPVVVAGAILATRAGHLERVNP